VGLAPTTASVLGVPLMQAMRERYPDVRLHMVESLSGHLSTMLNTRQLDLAVLFDTDPGRRWSVTPLLEEKLFLIRSRHGLPAKPPERMKMAQLAGLPLILPSGPHGLRSTLDAAFARAKVVPTVLAEIDSLPMLMDAVDAGLGCTLQPWAALGRFPDAQQRFHLAEISDAKNPPAELAVQPVGRRALAGRPGGAGGAGRRRPYAGAAGALGRATLGPVRVPGNNRTCPGHHDS